MNTDLELVNATLSGEKKAFGQLVLRYQKKVYRLVYRIIDNSFDASDIVQETFVKAYQNLEQLKDRDKFSSWLFQIAKNECISWIRKYQKNLFTVEDELESNCLNLPPAPDEILIEQELHEQVMKAISQLPEYNRKAVEMFYFEGKSYSEIQNELGVTKGTLGRWLHQARLELRKSLRKAYQSAILWISGGLKRVLKSNQCSGRVLSRPVGTVTNATVISTAKCLVVSMLLHVLLFTGMSITGVNWRIFSGTAEQAGYNSAVKISLVKTEKPNLIPLPSQLFEWKNYSRQSQETEVTTAKNIILESLPPKHLKIETVQIITVPKELVEEKISSQFTHPFTYSPTRTGKAACSTLTSTPVHTTIPLERSQSQLMLNNLRPSQDELIALDNAGQPLADSSDSETVQPKILFISRGPVYQPKDPEIYTMNIDGTEIKQITNFASFKVTKDGEVVTWSEEEKPNSPEEFELRRRSGALYPVRLSVSPDRRKIAFEARIIGEHGTIVGWTNIYIINIDGSNLKMLGHGINPVWSPDGRKIAFCNSSNRKIYVVNADSSGQIALNGTKPAWSPDGKKIAYVYRSKIYVVNADGSNEVELAKHVPSVSYLAWSPDGTKIVFSSNMRKDRRIRNIYVIDADGKNLKQLTHNRRINYQSKFPVWSPDGTKIAYVFSKPDRGPESTIINRSAIIIMDANGRNRKSLVNYAEQPIWSPDGKKILFLSDRNVGRRRDIIRRHQSRDYNEIYIIDVDGTDLKRLTTNYYRNVEPCWLPVDKKK